MKNYVKNKIKIAVGISGAGRSLENLIRVQNNHHYQVVGVFSSHPGAKGLHIATQNMLPNITIDFASSPSIKTLESWLTSNKVELIVLAGFIKKFPILNQYENRILNIHPALLPDFGGQGMYGIRVHQAVLKSGRSESGASVHLVSENYDEGPNIAQITVNIEDCKTAEQIAAKVFHAECKLYPKAIDFYYASLLDPKSRPPLVLNG